MQLVIFTRKIPLQPFKEKKPKEHFDKKRFEDSKFVKTIKAKRSKAARRPKNNEYSLYNKQI